MKGFYYWTIDTIFDIKWKRILLLWKKKNEIREVAKYSNDFNAVPLEDFSLVQKKILMTLIWLIKETDGSVITIDYERFIYLTISRFSKSLEDGIRLISDFS